MLWLYIQDTAFIPECQVTFGPKVPIKGSVLPTRELDSQERDYKGLFLFSCAYSVFSEPGQSFSGHIQMAA